MKYNFYIYLLVMAGVTYLIRMLPLAAFKKKIKNKFILSFLYYIPYAVLSVMTIPAIFYATDSMTAAAIGFLCAVTASYFGKSLVSCAAVACAAVFVSEYVINMI